MIIMAYGYGDSGSCWGYGSAVVIENYEGSLRLLVWGDINREDAVQIIDLAPAKESAREDDGVYPFRARRFDRQGALIEEHVFGSADEARIGLQGDDSWIGKSSIRHCDGPEGRQEQSHAHHDDARRQA